MIRNQIRIKGKIIDQKTKEGIPSLLVEAWDKDLILNDLLGSAITNHQGEFNIKLDGNYYREMFLEGNPDIFFKIYYRGKLIQSTENSILWNANRPELSILIDIDDPRYDDFVDSDYTLRGRVVHPDGTPATGFTISTFYEDLDDEKLIGKVSIKRNGEYLIKFSSEALSLPDKKPDLILKLFNSEGKEITPPYRINNALKVEVANLVVGNEPYRGLTEFKRLKKQINPFLKDKDLAELTQKSANYLSNKTGVNPMFIAYLIKGNHLEKQTEIPAEVFYGLFRQKLPTSFPALVTQDAKIIKRALKNAIKDNIIRQDILHNTSIDAILEVFQEKFIDQSLEEAEIPVGYNLGRVLNAGKIPKAQQRIFFKKYLNHKGSTQEFWKALRQDDNFQVATVKKIQFVLQLGVLTQNHPPLIEHLLKEFSDSTSIRDLATATSVQWTKFLQHEVNGQKIGTPPKIGGKDAEEKERNYIKKVMKRLEDAFPTDVFASKIKKEEFDQAQNINEFLKQNRNYDFRSNQPIKYFMQANPNSLDNIAEIDKVKIKVRLSDIQRLFKIVPRFDKYENIVALMNKNITSALKIRQMSKSGFIKKVKKEISSKQAHYIYRTASRVHALTLMAFGRYSEIMNNPSMYVLESQYNELKKYVQKYQAPRNPGLTSSEVANVENLFGSLKLCECVHCKSVYGASAYLVDLLNFLDDDRFIVNGGSTTALDILYKRRPDLGDIELNCKNINTIMPYVDLVNEILESAVREVSNTHQTNWSPEELRAQPEHLDPAAYHPLANAIYPWILPFNLWLEEARTYLGHLKVKRHELMDIFRKDDPAITPSKRDIAAEYLNLTPRDREIIVGEAPEIATRDFWGMKPEDWDKWMDKSTVSTFLKQTEAIDPKLKYLDLLEFKYVKFFETGTPPATIDIQFSGTDCDLDTATITNLSEPVLEKIHRFVRLQRKINFTTRELDAALRALPDHDLKDDFLINLYHVLCLKEKLNVKLIPLLSLWSNIDTVSIERLSTSQKERPSLYHQVFLNKTAVNPVEDIFNLEKLGRKYAITREPREVQARQALSVLFEDNIVNRIVGLLDLSSAIRGDEKKSLIVKYLSRFLDPADAMSKLVYPGTLTTSEERYDYVLKRLYDYLNTVEPYTSTIIAALEISEADLILLIENELGDKSLTLDSLSTLYHATFLSRALKLSIQDFISLRALCAIDPFDPTNIYNAIRFVKVVELIKNSEFNISELDYLLRHHMRPNTSIGSSAEQIQQILGDLRSEIQKIVEKYTFAPDPTGEKTRETLGVLFNEGIVNRILSLLNNTSTESKDEKNALIDDYLGQFLDPVDAKTKLVNPGTLNDNFYVFAPDPTEEQIRQALDILFEDNIVDRMMALLDLSSAESDDEKNALIDDYLTRFLDPVDAKTKLVNPGTLNDNYYVFVPDPTEEQARQALSVLFEDNIVKRIMTLLDLSSAESDDDKNALINDHLAPFLDDPAGAISKLVDPGTLVTAEERYDYVLRPLYDYLNNTAKERRFNYVLERLYDYLNTIAKERRFNHVIQPLYVYLRTHLPDSLVIQKFADVLNIDLIVCGMLLKKLMWSRATPIVMTKQVLEELFEDNIVKRIMTLLDLSSAESDDDKNALINDHLAPFLDDPAGAKTKLVGAGITYLTEVRDRFNYILTSLMFYLRENLNVIYNKLTAINDFLLKSFVESDKNIPIDQTNFPTQFDQFVLLEKIAMILNKFQIPSEPFDEVTWIFNNGPTYKWLDLRHLPLVEMDSPDPSLFEAWINMAKMNQLRNELPSGDPTLFELIRILHDPTKQEAEFRNVLVERTGWNKTDLKYLMEPEGFNLTYPAEYQNEKALERLIKFRKSFKLIRHLGVSAKQIWSWTTPDLTAGKVNSIKQAVKAKFEEKNWLKVAESLRDDLRKKQRQALIAYLVYNMEEAKDSNDLYDHFLIDVEMDPCMLTSRIKLAISTVQLFVLRCLMNLESEVKFTLDDAEQWKWRKYYRVWEANRKVFLYPENWIEPELRDDKSPFFVDLENHLLQSNITLKSAEQSFMNYLEKLDDVAKLEISGIHHQVEEIDGEKTDILHVFGRTYNTPHTYYYRTLINNSYWTPWIRVEVDIEGNHLIPIIFNRRLYIFWPIFMKAQDEEQGIPEEVADPEDKKPLLYWQIKLGWSEYKNGKWLPKKISLEYISRDYTRFGFKIPNQSEFVFRANTSRYEALYIDCYYSEPSDRKLSGFKEFYHIGKFYLDNRSGNLIAGIGWTSEPQTDDHKIPGTNSLNNKYVQNFGMTFYLYQALDAEPVPVLNFPNIFKIAYQINTPNVDSFGYLFYESFFYEDNTRTFFVEPEAFSTDVTFMQAVLAGDIIMRYTFNTFYHPFSCLFIKQLNQFGIDGILNPKYDPENINTERYQLNRQLIENDYFYDTYLPEDIVKIPHPKEDIDFCFTGAYSLYNWELFFHAPFLIANHLSTNQRFEEAQKWYHYIFDPTNTDTTNTSTNTARFWKIKPFFENGQGQLIQDLFRLVGEDTDNNNCFRRDLNAQIREWEDHPFNPHLIARMRITAYQKAVVMKYIDNLIAWGDHLFRRDTIESINEATQLYILAAKILGKRPEDVPEHKGAKKIDGVEVKTFNQLRHSGRLDAFSNVLTDFEILIHSSMIEGGGASDNPPPIGPFFFCIPRNEKLLDYWKTVEDRLFKIRYCMNIEGVVRQLPLFQPPIDPAMLVRAVAAGVDISSALNDIYASLPYYRFQIIFQKAVELCNDVKNLGSVLLSSLEKHDVEKLALIRSSHEIKLLDMIKDIKKQQIKAAEHSLEALEKSKQIAEDRKKYYESRKYMNKKEKLQIKKLESAHKWEIIRQGLELAAGALTIIPQFDAGTSGWAGSPVLKLEYGGVQIGGAVQAASRAMGMKTSMDQHAATMASIKGGYDRQKDDSKFQAEQATTEIEHLNEQIEAAKIGLAIAEQEKKNHEQQIENAKEIDIYMHDKFTNKELYNWMKSQISTIYFQSYQMVYDVAKKAERAYRHELGIFDSNFIQFGYWDGLKKGLLAGEKLYYDLKRMETSYFDLNRREYELTKHVSLMMLDPSSLIRLKQGGMCEVHFPEAIFDLDNPGHYMRRIKSVGLTIPCVTGPYTSVNCTLTLIKSEIRIKTDSEGTHSGTYEKNPDDSDARFIENFGAIESIVTSTARDDSGLFETNLRDERYLPFEGAGVISTWRLELPKNFKQFDYNTISDVIFHIRYTAREGGAPLKTAAIITLENLINSIDETISGLSRLFSMKYEFSTKFHQFLHSDDQKLDVTLSSDQFPYQFRDKTIDIHRIGLMVQLNEKYVGGGAGLEFEIIHPKGNVENLSPEPDETGLYGNYLLAEQNIGGNTGIGDWSVDLTAIPEPLKLTGTEKLNPESITDLLLICYYNISK